MMVPALAAQKLAVNATRQINAVVVSAGKMQRTVKARVGDQKWDGHIRKHFNRTAHVLVHDPCSSLRTGDVISISPGWRYSKHVHHVVNSIIAPFGEPLDERPPIPSVEERIRIKGEKRIAKRERRRERMAMLSRNGGGTMEGKTEEGKESQREREERRNESEEEESGGESDREPGITVL